MSVYHRVAGTYSRTSMESGPLIRLRTARVEGGLEGKKENLLNWQQYSTYNRTFSPSINQDHVPEVLSGWPRRHINMLPLRRLNGQNLLPTTLGHAGI